VHRFSSAASARTGEHPYRNGAAASRYIEARLSKFALEVIIAQNYRLGCLMMVEERNPTIFPLIHCFWHKVPKVCSGLSTKVLP
jgi:hypothetical protein